MCIRDRAIQEANDQSIRFRGIILRVEAQCKRIHETLRRGSYSTHQIKQWQKLDIQYRRALYRIAFEGLSRPEIQVQARIHKLQQRVLDIVDPQIRTVLYEAFILIINLLITLLTLGKANQIKEARTGNPWFLNQTVLGEQVRLLEKSILGEMDKPIGPGSNQGL